MEMRFTLFHPLYSATVISPDSEMVTVTVYNGWNKVNRISIPSFLGECALTCTANTGQGVRLLWSRTFREERISPKVKNQTRRLPDNPTSCKRHLSHQ